VVGRASVYVIRTSLTCCSVVVEMSPEQLKHVLGQLEEVAKVCESLRVSICVCSCPT